jgi:hypothetical protein
MRVWQALGIVDDIASELLPVHTYTWLGADCDKRDRRRGPRPPCSDPTFARRPRRLPRYPKGAPRAVVPQADPLRDGLMGRAWRLS